MSLAFVAGKKAEDLDTKFLDAVRWFANAIDGHRYNRAYGLKVTVTSTYREGDKGAHGMRQAVDIRGHALPNTDPDRRKLQIWLAALWAEAVARAGFPEQHWGFGTYPEGSDDEHIHLDTRPHTELLSAVWLGRD